MNTKRKIFTTLLLNLFFAILEFLGGIITGSVAITSDAIHDFGDATSIGVAYFLEKMSDKKPNKNYTYGYARFSVLGGLITISILLISSIIVIYNAVLRILTPTAINYDGMIVFALFGLIVNSISAYITHGGKSINQKAVNLHMLEDVLGWLVVLIGAVVMHFTNFYIIDPILSIFVAVFIIVNSVKNLADITKIFLIKTPKDIDINEITRHLKDINGVIDVHHLHVWAIDGEINCATLHVKVTEYNADLKKQIKEELTEHGISHVTVEMELDQETCTDKTCDIKRQTNTHCHHHH